MIQIRSSKKAATTPEIPASAGMTGSTTLSLIPIFNYDRAAIIKPTTFNCTPLPLGVIKSGGNDRFDYLIDPVIPAEAGIPGSNVSLFEPIPLTEIKYSQFVMIQIRDSKKLPLRLRFPPPRE